MEKRKFLVDVSGLEAIFQQKHKNNQKEIRKSKKFLGYKQIKSTISQ